MKPHKTEQDTSCVIYTIIFAAHIRRIKRSSDPYQHELLSQPNCKKTYNWPKSFVFLLHFSVPPIFPLSKFPPFSSEIIYRQSDSPEINQNSLNLIPSENQTFASLHTKIVIFFIKAIAEWVFDIEMNNQNRDESPVWVNEPHTFL